MSDTPRTTAATLTVAMLEGKPIKMVPVVVSEELELELDLLKSQLTKTHGCVTISRNGYVQEIEQQRDSLAEELDSLKQSILNLSHPNMKLILIELAEVREQRDRLAEALQRIIEWMDKSGHYDVTPYHQATDAFAAVKGEQYDARKHESHYP